MSALDDLLALLASPAFLRQRMGSYKVDQMARRVIGAFRDVVVEQSGGGGFVSHANLAALKVVSSSGVVAATTVLVREVLVLIPGEADPLALPWMLQWAPVDLTQWTIPEQSAWEPALVIPNDQWGDGGDGPMAGAWVNISALLVMQTGSKVIAGYGAPDANVGQDGDLFIDYIDPSQTRLASQPKLWKRREGVWAQCSPAWGENALLASTRTYPVTKTSGPLVGYLGIRIEVQDPYFAGGGDAPGGLLGEASNDDYLFIGSSADAPVYLDINTHQLLHAHASARDYWIATQCGRFVRVMYDVGASAHAALAPVDMGGGIVALRGAFDLVDSDHFSTSTIRSRAFEACVTQP